MYFDGSLMKEGGGARIVFILPLGVRMEYMIWLHFPVSNNAVDYEAQLNGLKIALEIGVQHLEIRGDSEIIVNQVMKEVNCINLKMVAYCKAVRELEDKFHGLEHKHVLQKYNEAVDTLAKVASNRMPVPNGVFTSNLREPSVHCEEDDYPSPPDLQEVMALGEALEPNLEDPTGGSQSWNGWWTKNSRVTAQRPDASLVGPSPSGSSMGIFTSTTRLEYSCATSSQTRGTNFCRTST
jgi:ribonuclease HI